MLQSHCCIGLFPLFEKENPKWTRACEAKNVARVSAKGRTVYIAQDLWPRPESVRSNAFPHFQNPPIGWMAPRMRITTMDRYVHVTSESLDQAVRLFESNRVSDIKVHAEMA